MFPSVIIIRIQIIPSLLVHAHQLNVTNLKFDVSVRNCSVKVANATKYLSCSTKIHFEFMFIHYIFWIMWIKRVNPKTQNNIIIRILSGIGLKTKPKSLS